jgi:rhamnose transport system ATP-binding protein
VTVTAATAATGAPAANPVAVRVVGMRKEYPGTQAVDFDPDQQLEFLRGEIHAVVGENGAGKSTLLSMIAGVTPPTDGRMWLDETPYAPRDVVEARRNGVDIVLQEPGLIDTMSVEENLLLGRERIYAPRQVFLPRARRRLAEAALGHIRRTIPLDVMAGSLGLEDQKFVELARALSLGPRVLVIDEMTANLSERGVSELFEALKAFAAAGGTVLYVSHYLEEVRALCDRVTVMKDGRLVRTLDSAATTEDELSTLMVGRKVKETMYRSDSEAHTAGETVMEVIGLSVPGRFTNVSFRLRRGEILGLGGLIGCGSETLALALFGDVRPSEGEVRIEGRTITPRQPRDAIALGMGFVPKDREREGLVLNLSLERNISLAALPWVSRRGFMRPGVERGIATKLIRDMRIVSRSHTDVPFSLSGGNRQKVVLAKWLVRQPKVLILHNPTRGVDVGGKAEIYTVIRELADRGVGLVLISDELPELIGLSDTLMIMRRGSVSAVVPRDAGPTEEQLIGFML